MWTIVPILASLLLTGVPDNRVISDESPPRKMDTQDAALREAREVDVPLLGRADRVVLEETARAGKGRKITVRKSEEIAGLVASLKVVKISPSGGETAATLRFFRGQAELRTVWVYRGGEWGFHRPGTQWTTGSSPELWKLVRQYLPK